MTGDSRAALVLCGGWSTRMGRDKAWLPFGGATMLEVVTTRVQAAVPDVTWVARAGQDLPAGSVPIIRDAGEGQGPLAALATALPTLAAEFVFVTACDQPLVKPAVVRRLFDLIGAADACVPVSGDHLMTMCAVYRRAPAAEAAMRLVAEGERRARALVEALNVKRVDAADLRDIDPELDSFLSCDTPEAYASALARLGQ